MSLDSCEDGVQAILAESVVELDRTSIKIFETLPFLKRVVIIAGNHIEWSDRFAPPNKSAAFQAGALICSVSLAGTPT